MPSEPRNRPWLRLLHEKKRPTAFLKNLLPVFSFFRDKGSISAYATMDFATLRLPVGAVRTKEPPVASPAPQKKRLTAFLRGAGEGNRTAAGVH